jgi:hypothetical protein
MDEVSRWSPDSDEASSLPSRPSTPRSVRTLLRSQGSPLRSLGKKLSLTGLSVRGRKTSPGKGEGTGANEADSLVGVEGGADSLHRRRRPSFRPLSIVVGRPFHLDVNRALDIVQISISPERDPVKRTPRSAMKTPGSAKLLKPAVSFAMSSPELSRPSNLSPSSSPPEDTFNDKIEVTKQRILKGDIRDLARLPPPDLSQHPSAQLDPYISTTDAPLMVTTSKKEEIKRLVKEARRRFDEKEREMEREEAEQKEAERQGTVRFKSLPKRGNAFSATYNNSGARVNDNPSKPKSVGMEAAITPGSFPASQRRPTLSQTPRQVSEPVSTLSLRQNFSRLHVDRDNEETHIYDILKEGSPLVATTSHQAKTSFDSNQPTTPASEGSKTGFRKVTGKLKPRLEKSAADDSSPIQRDMLHRPDLVSYPNSLKMHALTEDLLGTLLAHHHQQPQLRLRNWTAISTSPQHCSSLAFSQPQMH